MSKRNPTIPPKIHGVKSSVDGEGAGVSVVVGKPGVRKGLEPGAVVVGEPGVVADIEPGAVVVGEPGVSGDGDGGEKVPPVHKVHSVGKFDAENPQQVCGGERSSVTVTICQIVVAVEPKVVETPSALRFNHPGFACGHRIVYRP